MWLQQVVPSGRPMIRYPAAANSWSLVPMNSVSNAEPSALDDNGTFYLKKGVYIAQGSVTGTTRAVQAAIATVQGNPLVLDIQLVLLWTMASLSGSSIFVGLFEVPDDGSGGSSLGIYQYNTGFGPSQAVSTGLSEVYASLLLIEQGCTCPPLQFAMGQAFLNQAPIPLPLSTWTSFYLNLIASLGGGARSTEPPAGVSLEAPLQTSFRVPAGTYLVAGLVMSNLFGGVCTLSLQSQSQAFRAEDVLLESAGGSRGDPEFFGVVSVPDDGSGGSELVVWGFPLGRIFGTQIQTGAPQFYVQFAISQVAGPAQLPPLPVCRPFVPLCEYFSVYQAFPNGQQPTVFAFSGSAYAQLPSTFVSGLPGARELPELRSGCVLLPAGTWYVKGVTSGPAGRQPAAALLGLVSDPGAPAFQPDEVLLQSTNAFGGNMQFSGVVQVTQASWVSLFSTYVVGQSYGFPVTGSGLPELYSQLGFVRKV
jgi:hypothetical protein